MAHTLTFAKAGLAAALVLMAGAQAAQAQSAAGEPVIYPARQQDAKTQDMDRYQCHDWARAQSGYDPTRAAEPIAPVSAPQGMQPRGGTDPTGGMAKGALGGAALGELAHADTGRAAAVGALGGGLLTRVKEQQYKQQAAAQQQAAMQASAQHNARGQQRSVYSRASGACMEGRGYTVR